MIDRNSENYWKLYPIKDNWCVHNQGYITCYGSLYCCLRSMTVNKSQCICCVDKCNQLSLF